MQSIVYTNVEAIVKNLVKKLGKADKEEWESIVQANLALVKEEIEAERTKTGRKRSPGKAKKGITPYFAFSKEVRGDIAKKMNDEITKKKLSEEEEKKERGEIFGKISKEISKKWKGLSDEEKAKYGAVKKEEKQKKIKERTEKEMLINCGNVLTIATIEYPITQKVSEKDWDAFIEKVKESEHIRVTTHIKGKETRFTILRKSENEWYIFRGQTYKKYIVRNVGEFFKKIKIDTFRVMSE